MKTFSTCLKKTNVGGSNKVVKLREDRQLLARFLVVQQSRPELVNKLGDTIGDYELAVTPRSLFATDGTLLLPSDKSAFMKEIETFRKPPTSVNLTMPDTDVDDGGQIITQGLADNVRLPEEMSHTTVDVEETGPSQIHTLNSSMDEHDSNCDRQDQCEAETPRDKVIIIDAQAVVQSIKKSPGMDKISDFGGYIC